jgi:hypothetical protein
MARELVELGVVVREQGYDRKKPRTILVVPELPIKGTPFTHSNTVGNVVFTVRERVLGRTEEGVWRPTLQPEPGAFRDPNLLAFRRNVVRHLNQHSLPLTQDEFCDSMRGRKRARYYAAKASLEVTPLRRCDAYVSAFIKPEKWYDWKAGRAISARDPRYNLEVGCFLKPAEHRTYWAIDQAYGSPTIMKGYTPDRRATVLKGHWSAFQDPVAVGQDFSKFDQHISVPALQYEHGFYTSQYRGDAELQRLLSWQLRTKCYAQCTDGTVKYTARGGRMSGDMNTALGNCIISAALIWAYARQEGIRIRAIVDGDDSVTIMERKDLARYMANIVEFMRSKGFILTMEEPVDVLGKVEFCQCRYVEVDPPTMVRNPVKAITHDHLWVVREGMHHADILAATGLGGLSLYGNVPILGAYYHALSRASSNGLATLRRMERESSWLREATFTGEYREVTETARLSLWEAWGIAPEEQRQMESFFEQADLRYMANRQRSQDQNMLTLQTYFPSLNAYL